MKKLRILYCFLHISLAINISETHGNVYCKDNKNENVDWWYLYKMPKDLAVERSLSGLVSAYLTPGLAGRWNIITSIMNHNMLHYTLFPIFKEKQLNHLAVLVYQGTSGSGILMADGESGVWISHTVPGLPNLRLEKPTFPEEAIEEGHLMTCMSLNVSTLGDIAMALRLARVNVTYVYLPDSLQHVLHSWDLKSNEDFVSDVLVTYDFKTMDMLPATMFVRTPGRKMPLYMRFAKFTNTMLDVYDPTNQISSKCEDNYGIRNIESISVKQKEDIFYIYRNETDHARFAVSTAASWQRHGSGSTQYWVCTSNVNIDDDTLKGAVLTCLHDYEIWWGFTNLKVTEPSC